MEASETDIPIGAQGHQLKTLISGCEMHHRSILARHGSGCGLRTWPRALHTPQTTGSTCRTTTTVKIRLVGWIRSAWCIAFTPTTFHDATLSLHCSYKR